MATMLVELEPAPTTPLNLQLGKFYSPRAETPPFVAFRALQMDLGEYRIEGVDAAGNVQPLFDGPIITTFCRLAQHLRMDLPPS